MIYHQYLHQEGVGYLKACQIRVIDNRNTKNNRIICKHVIITNKYFLKINKHITV